MSKFVSFGRIPGVTARLLGAVALALICAVASADVTYEYDEAGRLRRATHDNGMITTYVLDAAGNRTQVTSAVAAGFLQLSASTYSGGEASGLRTITIAATRTFASNGAVSVPYTVTAGTATAGTDYTASNGSLSWASGDAANKTFTITVLDDAVSEVNETLTVALGAPTGGATLGTPATATVTISSDDTPPPGTLQLSASTYSGSEASGQRTITITGTRINGTNGAVSVPYTVTAGTATAGSDYTASNGTFTWANGDSATKTFTITVIDDSAVESNETLTVALGTPSGTTLGSPTSATVTIASDDVAPAGTLQFSASTYSGGEASALRTITVSVARAGGTNGAVSVPYTVTAGTADNIADYTASNGTLNWANGDAATKTFTITVVDDALFEPNETVLVALGSPTGTTLGSPSTATVTIVSDDTTAPGSLQFTAATASGSEASGQRTITLTVTRTGGSFGAVTAPVVVTGGTAIVNGDYSQMTPSVGWPDGFAGDMTVTFEVIDDSVFEANETINVALGAVFPAGTATIGSPSAVTITIVSDDNPPAGSVQFSSTSFSGGEASGLRTVTVTATRSGGSFGAVSAPYTVAGGTATAGSDYTASNGTLSWSDGDTANKSFTFTVLDDSTVESNETVGVSLGTPTGATLGSPNAATVTITSDDTPPPGTLQFVSSTYSGGEPSPIRIITAIVSRTSGSFGAVSVPYTVTAGTATAGSDYTATSSGTLSWTDGDTTGKAVGITVLDDSLVESNETLTISLGTPTGATLGSPTSTTVTISSDDNPPAGTVQLTSSSYSGDEASAQTITITATRANGSFGAASVAYSIGGGTATAGSDYTASNGTLSWSDGDAANKSFTITVVNDGAIESTETVGVTLSSPSGVTLGSPSSATVTIASDDASGVIALTSSTYSGTEAGGGSYIYVTATRTGGVSGAVSVTMTVTSGTAVENGDFYRPASFGWADGDGTSKTLAFEIIDDTLYEPNETFTIALQSPFPAGGATLGSPTSATCTIISNDNPSAGNVQLTSSTYSGGEASGTQSITISATRVGGSDGAGSVPYTITAGSATAGSDYTASNGTLSWGDGDAATKSFTITVVDDAAFESNETLTVALGTPTWVALGAPSTATVTISDNEAGGQVNIENQFVSVQGYPSASAYYYMTSAGEINASTFGGYWISPQVGMSNFEIYVSGNGSNCEGMNWDVWTPMSANRGWSTSATDQGGGGDSQYCTVSIQIRAISNPSVILDTAVIELSATAQ